MSYTRVLPRDAFNEANLLKCIGQISLLINDGFAPKFTAALWHYREDNSFQIRLDESSGDIYCTNFILRYEGIERRMVVPMYSRRPYPAKILVNEDYEWLFNEDGTLNEIFK